MPASALTSSRIRTPSGDCTHEDTAATARSQWDETPKTRPWSHICSPRTTLRNANTGHRDELSQLWVSQTRQARGQITIRMSKPNGIAHSSQGHETCIVAILETPIFPLPG